MTNRTVEHVENIPPGYEPAKATERGVVLAEGERTGHAHAIADATTAQLFRKVGDDTAILHVFAPGAKLEHEEHNTIDLAPGLYRVGIKRCYSEDEQGWAPVAD